MEVTALGGPHDGDTIAIDPQIKTIQYMVLPERSAAAYLEEAEMDARVEFSEVTYQVVRWYTGTDDTGGSGRMLMVVLAPDYWPKAGGGRPLYPPPEWAPP
jgi:hypothetical protein